MIKALIWSVVLYGPKIWTMKKMILKDWRSSKWGKSIGQNKIIANEEVLANDWSRRSLNMHNGKEPNKWIRHVLRGDSPLRTVTEWKMEEKKRVGRSRHNYDAVLDDGVRLWRAEGRGPTTRWVATPYIWTCPNGREPKKAEDAISLDLL